MPISCLRIRKGGRDMTRLAREVERLKSWRVGGAPDALGLGHGAEWESNYPHWPELLDAVQAVINQPEAIDDELADLVLFVLARDNEDELVADMLKESPATLRRLLSAALQYQDAQARWQIAAILPSALKGEAEGSLVQLGNDTNDYVRRRASIALSQLRADEPPT